MRNHFVICLILFGFLLGTIKSYADLNDSECVKTVQITTAESSWDSRTVCNSDNISSCIKPPLEKANLPLEYNHGKKTKYVAVLFHGLSDSPYFLKDIGHILFQSGMNVIIPRLTGHGTCPEHLNHNHVTLDDWIGGGKQKGDLKWALEMAKNLGDNTIIGGFSFGGSLATWAVMNQLQDFAGLILFSPALKLHKKVKWKVQLGAFFSTPLHRIYGAEKIFGQRVRYQKISVEGSYQVHLLYKKIDNLKKKNKGLKSIPTLLSVTENDQAVDLEYVIDYVSHVLQGPKQYIVYGPMELAEKRNLENISYIVDPEIKHSSLVLENAQWSEPEENTEFSVFKTYFESFLKSSFL